MHKQKWLQGMVALLLLTGLGVGAAFAQSADDTQPWIGISLQDQPEGVRVMDVASDSPAEEADLQVGDLIVAIDGDAIAEVEALIAAVSERAVGEVVVLEVEREAETLEIEVTLGERPADLDTREREPMGFFFDREGVSLPFAGALVAPQAEGWEVVTTPDADSPLETGDLIVAVDGESVANLSFAETIQTIVEAQGTLALTVQRGDEELSIEAEAVPFEGFVMPNRPGDFNESSVRPVNRIVLGVRYRLVDAALAEELGLEEVEGALITEVIPDTPAEAAGLQVDDVILEVDDQAVSDDDPLNELLEAYAPGAEVELEVLRDGELLDIQVQLAERGLMIMPETPNTMPPGNVPGPGNGRGGEMRALRDLADLLARFVERLPEEGSLVVTCSLEDEPLFTLQFERDADGEAQTVLTLPGVGFEELREVDFAALDCAVEG
ncbi:MAG: PDZ domain-containing protein, partial [Anaerolineae bacterium]|nr:PDZ domain-containing protein [Anaerolineae bacterium]